MYQTELARSGKALFRIRGSYLLTTFAIGVVIAYFGRSLGPFQDDSANRAWFWVSLGVAVSGALVRIVTSGYAALGTSGVTKDEPLAAELNTTGPYSLVRNPLYLGRILNFTGIAMLSGSWVFGALTFLISILVYERISVFEEEFLRQEFGPAHAEWAKDVPFLMPRFKGWVKPKYPFWWRRCIKREDKKVTYLFNTVAANDFARSGFDTGRFTENPALYGAFAVAVLGLVIARSLRYFTKTFDGIS